MKLAEWLFGKREDIVMFNEEREEVIATLSRIEREAVKQKLALMEMERKERVRSGN